MPISLESVSYTYAPGTAFQCRAIDGLSLTVDDGEFVGIMGSTGSGKSTLIQLMAGLLTPSSGRVLLDGEDIHPKSYDRIKLRRRVGLVFQYPEYQLFERTVEKDVGFALRRLGYGPEETREAVRRALKTVGLDYDKVRDKSPLGFSGGEKRRIAIAGVLASDPGILILDEPVAGLDPLGRDAFLDMVEGLNAKGVTILMVSHNADALSEHARRIVTLKEGRVFLDGSVKEVFSDIFALKSCGICCGQSRLAAELLRKRGMDIPEGTVKYEELLSSVLSARGGEGK